MSVAAYSRVTPRRVDGSEVDFAVFVVIHALQEALTGRVDAPIRSAILSCVTAAQEPMCVSDLAAMCRCSERTLSRRLREARLPAPHRLIAWGKILVASQLLIDPTRSLERVAFLIGLDGSAALVHLFRRHAGVTPGDVRRERTLHAALSLFESALSARADGAQP